MTKAEIVSRISEQTGIEKIAVLAVVESFMETVKDSMCNKENVYLRGFGTFGVIERKEKVGRNITKGTSVVIPAHKIPMFKPCKEFKAQVK